jgi:mannose-6-phosphate isomerase-like protein (cupin superfamily)
VEPFCVGEGEGERLAFSGATFLVKAAGDTTGGSFSVIEESEPLDTPRHVHDNEDELFVILEGEHVFTIGPETFQAGPGAVVFAPRRVPHEHRRVVPRVGRFLTFVSPPGFEGFFRELSEAERSGNPMDEAYTAVSEKYGVSWLS